MKKMFEISEKVGVDGVERLIMWAEDFIETETIEMLERQKFEKLLDKKYENVISLQIFLVEREIEICFDDQSEALNLLTKIVNEGYKASFNGMSDFYTNYTVRVSTNELEEILGEKNG